MKYSSTVVTTDPSLTEALERLKISRPKAKFVQHSPIATSNVENDENSPPFQYVSLYEHRISNHFEQIKGHQFIIDNGFISSFVYNVALSWLWYQRQEPISIEHLTAVLRHNYKKFYAECILFKANVQLGRALLLETLIYEQDLMRPIFPNRVARPELDRMARILSQAMGEALANHELIHLFVHRDPIETRAALQGIFDGKLLLAIDEITSKHESLLGEELLCDGYAASQLIHGEDSFLAGFDKQSRYRIALFFTWVFCDLVSLEYSAHCTAETALEEEHHIDLDSIKRPQHQFSYAIEREPSIVSRAHNITKLIVNDARRNDVELFGTTGDYPMPENSQSTLSGVYETFINTASPYDNHKLGISDSQRGQAGLVAESLKEHPDGINFLLWRSKNFNVGGTPADP